MTTRLLQDSANAQQMLNSEREQDEVHHVVSHLIVSI
jgi:hypothetical protein